LKEYPCKNYLCYEGETECLPKTKERREQSWKIKEYLAFKKDWTPWGGFLLEHQ